MTNLFKDYWWGTKDTKEVCPALFSVVDVLKHENANRINLYKNMTSLYREKSISGFEPHEWGIGYSDIGPLTYNVSKSCTDTVVAKITLHEPKPKFTTYGGSEDLQDKARGCEKLVQGVMQREKAYLKAQQAFRDCCIYGEGILKVYDDYDGKVRVKRVHPSRILVDDKAAIENEPISLYERRLALKTELLARYPKKKKAIFDSMIEHPQRSGGKLIREYIELVEAWKRPIGKTSGRHVVAVNGGVLLDEEWEDGFPFVVYRYSEDIQGWHGIGLIEDLSGIQEEINHLLGRIHDNADVLARPFWLRPKGAEIEDEYLLSDLDARMVDYAGQKPELVLPPAVNPQIIQLLETLYQRAFEIAGLSQLSATSRTPANLESGAALRTYLDVETTRFSVSARRWERGAVDLGHQIMDCARRIVRRKGAKSFQVLYQNKDIGVLEPITGETLLKNEEFYLQVYPISALPQQPAARLERVMEMKRDQMIDEEEFAALSDMPDLEKHARRRNAPYQYLERIMEKMARKGGTLIRPVYYMDLPIGIQLAKKYWALAKTAENDEAAVLYEEWIEEAISILEADRARMEEQQMMMQMESAEAPPPPNSGPPSGPGPQLPMA
jgi:hypothetical protein